MKKDTVFIIPFILPWDHSADYQRQTCLELAKHGDVVAYMQKDAVFFLKALIRRPLYPSYKNIRFYRPTYLFPFRRFGFIETVNRHISYMLFEAFSLWGKRAVLWVFDPSFWRFPAITRGLSLYDCVDYHAGFHTGQKKKEVQRKERELIRSVDYFFVNSRVLHDIHKKTRIPDGILPQGFRLDDFRNPIRGNYQFPNTKPIIGYVGAIDDRLDYSLVENLIRRNPQWQFVLWGPGQLPKEFQTQPNVIRGESTRSAYVPDIIKQFDVGMIPRLVRHAGARFAYPMKVFEYFYMGKPAVATPIMELKRFGAFVQIGSTVDEWERHIGSLLARPWPKDYQRQQRKLATENSWEKKITAILYACGMSG